MTLVAYPEPVQVDLYIIKKLTANKHDLYLMNQSNGMFDFICYNLFKERTYITC